jgi:predicted transcriptional regulator
MIFDTEEVGLLTLFRPYQAALMEYIWEMNERERVGLTSGQLYNWLLDHPDSKSRASVIFFMNDMVDEGVLEYETGTGKGGYHRIYYPKMTKKQFADYVVEKITSKLREAFTGTQ